MRVNLFLTDDCNMACKYCYVNNKMSKYMSEKTIEKSIDYLYSKYKDEKINIIFQGGEPLLNEKLLYYAVNYISEINEKAYYGITTNGTLLNEKNMCYFEEHDFLLRFSIDGHLISNDKNRIFKNGNGTYDVLSKKLKLFKEYKGTAKALRLTITINNVQYFSENVEHFLDMGIYDIDFGLNHLEKWNEKSIDCLKTELKKIADLYIYDIREGNKRITLSFYDKLILDRHKKASITNNTEFDALKQQEFCGLGNKTIAINTNGDVYPCSLYVGDSAFETYKMGSVMDKINEFDFKYDFSKKKVCEECKLKYYCFSNCVAINKLCTDNFYEPPLHICELNKALIFNADRIFTEKMKKRDRL